MILLDILNMIFLNLKNNRFKLKKNIALLIRQVYIDISHILLTHTEKEKKIDNRIHKGKRKNRKINATNNGSKRKRFKPI